MHLIPLFRDTHLLSFSHVDAHTHTHTHAHAHRGHAQRFAVQDDRSWSIYTYRCKQNTQVNTEKQRPANNHTHIGTNVWREGEGEQERGREGAGAE